MRKGVARFIAGIVRRQGSMKVSSTYNVTLRKYFGDRDEVIAFFFSKREPPIITTTNVDEIARKLYSVLNRVNEQLEQFVQNGSGWVVDRVRDLYINFARYVQLCGGTYEPLKLWRKQAIINTKNRDNQCLRWALRAAKFPTRDTQSSARPSKYPQHDGFDFTGVNFPTPLSEIPRVEQQNNLAINVFGREGGKVVVLRNSDMPHKYEPVNVMLTVNKETGNWQMEQLMPTPNLRLRSPWDVAYMFSLNLVVDYNSCFPRRACCQAQLVLL